MERSELVKLYNLNHLILKLEKKMKHMSNRYTNKPVVEIICINSELDNVCTYNYVGVELGKL